MRTEQETDSTGIEGTSDSNILRTRPGSLLITGLPQYRLAPVFKVNYDAKSKTTFTGTNTYIWSYQEDDAEYGNRWNGNMIPGLRIVNGFNMVNISHFNLENGKTHLLFEKPVLIKNFYFPAATRDTLHFQPVKRDYYLVSVFYEDTNNDGYLNMKDLRHLYAFDADGQNRRLLVPADYSVMKSEYDPGNDFLFVYAQSDDNKNGQIEREEAMHIFLINLKNPQKADLYY